MKSLIYSTVFLLCFCKGYAANNAIYAGGNGDGFAVSGTGGSGTEVPLPVGLLSFAGECDNKNNILKWSTATEVNNNYFTLEQSADALHWQVVGTVKGTGNSSSIHKYVFTDENKYNAISYYRLKQTDFDGKFEYYNSHIIPVQNCGEGTIELSVYPNPSNGNYTLISNTNINSISIANLSGEMIYQQQGLNSGNIKFDISGFPRGIYLMKVRYKGQIFTKLLCTSQIE
jgi:hypothetical protein